MYAIRPWLYLGKYRETTDLPLLQQHHIGAMLQFAGIVEYPAIQTLYLPIEDGIPVSEEILALGVDFILTEYQQERKVLVACEAGISRSVAFVIAALKETEKTTLLEAYQAIVNVHAGALPHPALWKSLCAIYQEDSPYWLLLKRYNQRTSSPTG